MKELYFAAKNRYENGMQYERCGRSGVLLPKVSLGFWHNFGSVDPYERSRQITHYAFSRYYPLRPRQQLRPRLRLCRRDDGQIDGRGFPPLSR